MRRAAHSTQAQLLFQKDPDFELETLGEPPLLYPHEAELLGLYFDLRAGTSPDRGVDPATFLSLLERLSGPADADLTLSQLRAMDSTYSKHVKDKYDREAESRKKKARGGRG